MNSFETLDNRCRVCALELSDLTCSIPILGESSFSLQAKISKYLYITVRLRSDLIHFSDKAMIFMLI